ncbi:MAG: T9SS type A sorting domain-containing protein [Bacteroidota bacterium]
MKKLYYSLIWVAIFAFASTQIAAQPSYCLRLVQTNVTATTVEIDIQIQFSATSGLGSSNLQILYDNTRLTSPILGTDAIPPPFYSASTVTSPTTSKVSYNIELLVPNFGIMVETPSAWTSVGTVVFTYSGSTPTTLTWSYTGTTTETVVFDHNEMDQLFATSSGAACLQPVTLFSVLPIELSSFEAEWLNDNQREAKLDWTTLSETNNEKFEIQRSFDGLTWRVLDEVPGLGNSSEPHSYSYIDETVGAEMSNDFVYYRIAQIDFSGQVTMSEVRALNKSVSAEDVSVFPNPFTDGISMLIPQEKLGTEGGQISIEDIAGRTIITKSVEGAYTDQLIRFDDVETLVPGIYIIKFESGTNVFSRKIVRQ